MNKTVVSISFLVFAIVACPAATGCAAGGARGPGAESGGAAGSTVLTSTVASKRCPAAFSIDDAEDDNNQVLSQNGRGGYWYTYADKLGTHLTPSAGARFTMSPGGANGSARAARMAGTLATTGEPLFGGMGLSFTNPKRSYDASAFTGISFWAKGEGESHVRLKVPDVNTDPAGGVCAACFNDFGVDIAVTPTWTRYTVPFASLAQLDGWGSPHPAAVDTSKLYGLQWQVVQAGAHFDVAIDDVEFICP